MKQLKQKIIRSFILHTLLLSFILAVINDGVDYFLERYVQEFGTAYLVLMLVLNLVLFCIAVALVGRSFYRRIKVFIDDEVHQQVAREHFLYSAIAHDLKTPMTVIKGYAQALMDDKIEEAKQKEIYGIIREKTDHAVILLNDLLTYSRLLHATSNPQEVVDPIDLSSVIVRLIADNYWMIEERAVHYELDVDGQFEFPILEMDFYRICENLLVNAIKHNPPGTSLKFGIQERDKDLLIYLADSGNEIQVDHLFGAFHTGDSARTAGKGYGLGLAIVSKLVEKYHGSIGVESPYDSFTKAFIVRFPKPNQNYKK